MSPNTPGGLGYAWALVISWFALTVELVVVDVLSGAALTDTAIWGGMLLVAGAVIVPVGGLGMFLAHLLCREETRQRSHVLAVGACAGMLTLLTVALVPFFAVLVLAAAVLVAMVGRAALVPLVHERQQDAVPAGR